MSVIVTSHFLLTFVWMGEVTDAIFAYYTMLTSWEEYGVALRSPVAVSFIFPTFSIMYYTLEANVKSKYPTKCTLAIYLP